MGREGGCSGHSEEREQRWVHCGSTVKTPVKCSFLLPGNKGLHIEGPCKPPQVPPRIRSLQTKGSSSNPDLTPSSYMSGSCCFEPGTKVGTTDTGELHSLISFSLYFVVEKLRHGQGKELAQDHKAERTKPESKARRLVFRAHSGNL